MAEAAKVRLVRCPRCENILPELPDFSLYQCGGCGEVLKGIQSLWSSPSLSNSHTIIQTDNKQHMETSKPSFHYVDQKILKKDEAPYLSLASPSPPPEKVFGRNIEKKNLLSKLLYSDKKATQLSTVPVLGVSGIGKTTLARLVYEDGAVKEHFQLRAWVKVHGPELKLHLAAQGILKCAVGMSCSVDDMDELDEMVRDVLNSNRCLIVFDGIDSMGEDSWLHMNENWFGFVDLGSRVLITTPNKVVANLVAENPLVLSRLSMDDSLSLFRHLSFGFSEGKRDMSESLAQDVAALCQGHPLLLKLVVSQIRFDDSLSNRLSSDGILSTNSDESAVAMMCVLALPPHLREFLTYCSFFAQGYAMDKEKIIRMWNIADGFVMMSSPTNAARPEEDIGESYFRQLIHRSFFTDITRDGYGEITYFQVPGLIHKAAEDVAATLFRERLGVIGSIGEIDGRLSIVLPSPGEYYSAQRVSVLIFSPIVYPGGSSLDHSLVEFKGLKSLVLSCSGIRNLSDDVGGLNELRYLDLSYTRIESLPESIAELSELRTLDLSWCFQLKILPEGMRKLMHMRHLDLARCESLSYLPSGIELLTSLHSMPLFVLGEDHDCAGLAELGSLNNLRGRLEIRNLENVRKDSEAKDAKLEQKNIQHLGLSWSRNADNCYNVLNDLKPCENLQVLDLTNYMGSIFPTWMEHLNGLIKISINNCGCEVLPSLGQLPYLNDLQLKGMNNLRYIDQVFHGDAGSHGHIFPSLEKLGLYDLPVLVKWEYIYDFGGTDKCAFPSMNTLTIEGCPELRVWPSLPTLPELIVCDSHFHVLHSSDKLTSLSSLLIKDVDWCVSMYNLSRLRSLKKLILFNIKDKVLNFPSQHGALVSLEHLGILHCHSLVYLSCPDPTSLQKLHFKDCQSLREISWSRENHLLFELVVEDCPRLVDYVGISLSLLRSVRKVIIKNCGVYNPYPGDRKLEKLEYLFVGGCPELESYLLRRPEDISHIPCVILNNRKAKYEDSKHFERELELPAKGKLLPTVSSLVMDPAFKRFPGRPQKVPPSPSRFSMSPELNRPEYVHLNMDQVMRATNNFSSSLRIGEGGFGTVYKAQLSGGQVVAIKRARKEHLEALRINFRSEVELLAKIDHRNLVKLLGYAEMGKELLIMTEYVSNGTLRDHLDGIKGKILDFKQRLDISIDVAHGLTYLHMYAEKQVIHGDVKSSNILLTERFRAKVADFGFARLGDDSEKTYVVTKVKGTPGYLDPEYMMTFQLTTKSDVYSFAILLLEILTGRRPVEMKRQLDERVTIKWAFRKYNEGRIREMVDPVMEEHIDKEILVKMFGLAIQCAAVTRVDRPDMKAVSEQLWEIRMDYLKSGRRV